MSEKAHLSVLIPKELMKDLKLAAIYEETTVTNIVIEVLQEYVKKKK